MTRYRSPGRCRLCGEDIGKEGMQKLRVCLICGWKVVTHMGEVYNAAEIGVLERIRYYEKHGKPGPKKPRKESKAAGYVYYIRMGGLVKIGYAGDVAKRMRNYPPNAELAAAHPGTLEVERDMHARFKDALARGREWFQPTPDLEEHIAQVRDAFGDPASLAYEFTVPKSQEQRVRDQFKPRHAIGGIHPVVR